MNDKLNLEQYESVSSIAGRIGVYGFAKSYCYEKPEGKTEEVPYFYRGELNDVVVGNKDIYFSCDESSLSEEFEIIWILKVLGKGYFEFKGVSFGNDLTDAKLFGDDPAKILLAKTPQASMCDKWWPCSNPPEKMLASVERIRNDLIESYEVTLGSNYIKLSYKSALNLMCKMPGVNNFDYLFIYTGATRGFFWKSSSSRNNDIIQLIVKGFGCVIKNRILKINRCES